MKKNKKGFIFIETLIVLVVLLVTVMGMYKMYTKISTDIDYREYFDNISDLYKTDIIRSEINKNQLTSSNPLIEINKTNCTSYMSSSCPVLIASLKIEAIYINLTGIDGLLLSENLKLKNSMKRYLKTINNKKGERYIIVNFLYNNKNYYASLDI